METEESICLVGGGAAGVATARVLYDRGSPFTWQDPLHRVGQCFTIYVLTGLSTFHIRLVHRA
jgi:hypothetical protein